MLRNYLLFMSFFSLYLAYDCSHIPINSIYGPIGPIISAVLWRIMYTNLIDRENKEIRKL